MSEVPAPPAVYRVLLAVDRPDLLAGVLQSIAVLACGSRTELVGLFVEDANLERLAGLPIAREILHRTGTERTLEWSQLERQLKAQAALVRRSLESLASALQMQCSFKLVRGEVRAEVLAAAGEADLVVVEVPFWPTERRARLGPAVLGSVASKVSRTLLLLPSGVVAAGRVLALFDGVEGCDAALDAAVQVAHASEQELVVLVPADAAQPPRTLQGLAEQALRERGATARFHWLVSSDERSLGNAVRRQGAGMLVLAGEQPLAHGLALPDLLSRIRCPVLLVR
jgi:nucleotide-binding universal stress UspA family protein